MSFIRALALTPLLLCWFGSIETLALDQAPARSAVVPLVSRVRNELRPTQFEENRDRLCIATILDRGYVITAAHCLEKNRAHFIRTPGPNPKLVEVRPESAPTESIVSNAVDFAFGKLLAPLPNPIPRAELPALPARQQPQVARDEMLTTVAYRRGPVRMNRNSGVLSFPDPEGPTPSLFELPIAVTNIIRREHQFFYFSESYREIVMTGFFSLHTVKKAFGLKKYGELLPWNFKGGTYAGPKGDSGAPIFRGNVIVGIFAAGDDRAQPISTDRSNFSVSTYGADLTSDDAMTFLDAFTAEGNNIKRE